MAVTESNDIVEQPTADPLTRFEPDEEFLKRRRARSVAIACLLVAMVVLFYVVTLVKLGPGVLDRPM